MTWPVEGWWLLPCAFAAEVIGTMAGFGAATILTPVAALFVDIKSAIALVALFHLLGNASRLVFFGRSVNWRIWALFGVTGVVCSLLGARVAARMPSEAITAAFGVFLLAYVALSLSPLGRRPLPSAAPTLVGGGAASGFIAGLIGTGGAIRSACLLAFQMPKEAYLGTSAAIALIVDATRLPVYVGSGFLAGVPPALIAGLIPSAFAGAWTGQRLVRNIPPETFRAMVLVLLGLMGVKMLWDGLNG
jgi:hypothetical protein